MIAGEKLKRRAWDERERLHFPMEEVASADEMIAALQTATGLTVCSLADGDPLLAGAAALLDILLGAIYIADIGDEQACRHNTIHEFAHYFLHREIEGCASADLAVDLDATEGLPISVVDGYSPRERRESEANAFASEFLLPLPLARRLFEESGWSAGRIAQEIGVSEAVAFRQLTDAVLMPLPARHDTRSVARVSTELDPSQTAASTAALGPVLISAGPGTGKTKTLVERCTYLTKQRSVKPSSILALTFSRKAAVEMSERLIATGVVDEGSGPWIGTFHSFGMELLRKYGDRIGLDPGFQVIGTTDAVTLLENNLSKLGLKHLKSLRDPAQRLPGILNKIGRAKDELLSPVEYTALSEVMTRSARDASEAFHAGSGKKQKKEAETLQDALDKAARVAEVAVAYEVYESLLADGPYVDYADLLVRSVDLLQRSPDVRRSVQSRYPHVLADEYQDVNRASARLLKLVATDDARGLWVVGDHRQSIYQFQGASPANVSRFLTDYPNGRLHELAVNYRSVREIVDTFAAAAQRMSFAATPPGTANWSAHRGPSPVSPAVSFTVSKTTQSQYRTIAQKIEGCREAGYSYRQQALLLRTHAQAREAATELARLGVPTLYLGRLLDRPEVQDLIALIAQCGAPHSGAFVRAAAMPEYAVDAAAALRAFEEEVSIQNMAPGLDLLRAHLLELRSFVERPAALLRKYIFDLSRFLSATGHGEFDLLLFKMAVRQFIGVVEAFELRAVAPTGEDGRNACVRLLAHLRRLSSASTPISLPDAGAIDEIDAVRIATVHSVKGLEFPVVFIPNLNEGSFPSRSPHDGIPQLTRLSNSDTVEADEEECLFFVALSRARDRLFLSRSVLKASGKPSQPSSLLQTLTGAVESGLLPLEECVDEENVESVWPDDNGSCEEDRALPFYTAFELEQYERCPRLYYFERVAHLEGAPADDGYRRMHRVVNDLMDWVETQTAVGPAPPVEERRKKLDELWLEQGPVGHRHESLYRAEADTAAEAYPRTVGGVRKRMSLTARLDNALVQVRPDHATVSGETLILTRRVVGARRGGEQTDKRLALLRKAANDSYPDLTALVQLHFVADGVVDEATAAPRYEPARLAKYEKAAAGIQSKRFPPSPQSSDACTSCRFLFICEKRSVVVGDAGGAE